MKTASLYLLLFAIAAYAQPADRDAMVARLNADLMPLRSLPFAPETSSTYTEIANGFASDFNKSFGPKGFITRNLAGALTAVLANKDLSDETLTPLTSALLDISGLAFACGKSASCELVQSDQFRASIEQAYTALTALHVSVANTQTVMRFLYQAADRIAHPTVRPIPPG